MPYLVFLALLGFVFTWQRWQQTTFSSASLHAAAAVLIGLYVAGLSGTLPAVTLLLIVLGAGLLLYQLASYRQGLIAAGLPAVILLLLCALFWLIHANGHYVFYDEYAHWGVFIRDMLATGQFWGAESNAMHLRYPPGAPLWQYFFAAYTEETDGVIYFAQFVLLILPLVVLWNKLQFRQIGWVVLILALLVFLISNFGHGIANLYVDHLLATWFAGLLLNFLAEYQQRSCKQLLWYALPLAVLPLLKDVGTLLVLYVATIMTGLLALKYVQASRPVNTTIKNCALFLATLLATVALVVVTWSVNRDSAGIAKDTQSITGVAQGLLGGEQLTEEAQQIAIAERFRTIFLHQQISKDKVSRDFNEFSYGVMEYYTDPWRLTTASLIIICLLVQLLVWRLYVAKPDQLQWLLAYMGINLATITYIGVLFLSYQFAFGDDGLRIPSYVRYAHSLLLPLVLISLAPLLPAFRPETAGSFNLPNGMGVRTGTVFLGVILSTGWLLETPYLKPLYSPANPMAARVQMRPIAATLHADSLTSTVWVYLPMPQSYEIFKRIVRLELSPLPTTVVMQADFLDQTKTELMSVWQNYDYLWFPSDTETSERRRQELFGEAATSRLLKVDKIGTKTTLIPVKIVTN